MKIEKTTILAFVAVTFISGLLTKANANIIVNGSFENGPPVPSDLISVSDGSTAINGWQVTQDDIDYIGTLWVSSHGVRSLDLDNSTGFGGIKQTFDTVPNMMYLVTFDMAGNPYREKNDPYTKHMGVSVAEDSTVFDSAEFSFDTTGHSFGAMGWVTRNWQFTAISNSTTLAFYSLHLPVGGGNGYAGYSGWCGPTLDNVSVVPEPATISLLGLGGLLLRRKRRAKSNQRL